VFHDFSGGNFLHFFNYHNGLYGFLAFFIRYTRHSNFCNTRMTIDDILDLREKDKPILNIKNVLLSIGKIYTAIFIPGGNIFGL